MSELDKTPKILRSYEPGFYKQNDLVFVDGSLYRLTRSVFNSKSFQSELDAGIWDIVNSVNPLEDIASSSSEGDFIRLRGGSFTNESVSLAGQNSTRLWLAPTSGTTPATLGFGNIVSGTASFQAASGASIFQAEHAIGYQTSTAAQDICGKRHGSLTVSLGQGFEYECRFTANGQQGTGQQVFIGLIGQTTAPSGATNITTLTNVIGVGLAQTGNTNMRSFRNDGSGGVLQDIATFSSFLVTSINSYVVNIKSLSGTSCRIRVSNVGTGVSLESVYTTDLPAATQLLSPIVHGVSGATPGFGMFLKINRQSLFSGF